MDFLYLALALLLRLLKVLLPWVVAFFLTLFLLGLAGIKGYLLLTFLFGFFLVGLFLREEVFPLIFKDK